MKKKEVMVKNGTKSWRGRFNRLISNLQKKRGGAAEARFFAALLTLVKAGFIKHFLYTNQKHIRVIKKLDYLGIDFVVFKNDGSAVTVQVKSSDVGMEKFKKKNLPEIKSVQISYWEDNEDTLRKAVETILDEQITFEEVMKKVVAEIPEGGRDV